MTKGTVAILVGPEYEDLEVWYPKLRLEEAGYSAPLVGIGDDSYRGKWGYPAKVDIQISDLSTDTVVGVLAPGGWAPDKLRRIPEVLDLVRAVNKRNQMVATICHGPWVLISAGIVAGKTLTSTVGIRDDVTNAGANWVDEPSVIDGNIVSARVPKDLPAFAHAMLNVLESQGR